MEWTELNRDGCNKSDPSNVRARKLLWDIFRTWITDFVINIKICSSIKVELWVIIIRSELVWVLSNSKLILESNYVLVIDFITKKTVKIYVNHMLITRAIKLSAR